MNHKLQLINNQIACCDKALEKLKSEKSNPFSEAQRELAPFLSLETIDSALFSLDPRFQDAFFPATCE